MHGGWVEMGVVVGRSKGKCMLNLGDFVPVFGARYLLPT